MDPISSYPSTSATTTKPENGTSTKTSGLTERVKETFDGVSHKVTDAASSVKQKASDAASSVKQKASDRIDSSRIMVQDNPLRTVAITLGAGVVIGLILSRALR